MSLIGRIMDLVIPRTCCVCGKRLAANEETVCTSCLLRLPFTGFLNDPYQNEMAKVFWGRISNFEKAFALVRHIPHALSAKMIYQLKYSGKPDIGIDVGKLMGKMMQERGFFEGMDYILPVPLARERQAERGYNQSEMIAEGLREVSRLPVVKNAVRRVSFGGSQTEKSRVGRSENVENVFEVVNVRKINGRHLLIVDDVVTTGATVCSLAKTLHDAAENVRISVAAIGYAGMWRGMGKAKK